MVLFKFVKSKHLLAKNLTLTSKNLLTDEPVQHPTINDLPDEVIVRILSHLPTRDLVLNISLVSRRFNRLSKDRDAFVYVSLPNFIWLNYRRQVQHFLEGKNSIEHVEVNHLNLIPYYHYIPNEELKNSAYQLFHHLVFRQKRIKSLTLRGDSILPFSKVAGLAKNFRLEHLEIRGTPPGRYPLRNVINNVQKLTLWNTEDFGIGMYLAILRNVNMDILQEINMQGPLEQLTLKNRCLSLTIKKGNITESQLHAFIVGATEHADLTQLKIASGGDKYNTRTRIDITKGKALFISIDTEHVSMDVFAHYILKHLKSWIPRSPRHSHVKFRYKDPDSLYFLHHAKSYLPPNSMIETKRYFFRRRLF